MSHGRQCRRRSARLAENLAEVLGDHLVRGRHQVGTKQLNVDVAVLEPLEPEILGFKCLVTVANGLGDQRGGVGQVILGLLAVQDVKDSIKIRDGFAFPAVIGEPAVGAHGAGDDHLLADLEGVVGLVGRVVEVDEGVDQAAAKSARKGRENGPQIG